MLQLKPLTHNQAVVGERAWIVVEEFIGSYFVNGYVQFDGSCQATYSPPPFDNEQDALRAARSWATARGLSVVHVVEGRERRRR
jgi:hypothetical protein